MKENLHKSMLLAFHSIEDFGVYNCSIPSIRNDKENIYGRVELRDERAASWVRLFEKTAKTITPLCLRVWFINWKLLLFCSLELMMGGAHAVKESSKYTTCLGCFYRRTDLSDLLYFTKEPNRMVRIRRRMDVTKNILPVAVNRKDVFYCMVFS